jgi:hypothetical protein
MPRTTRTPQTQTARQAIAYVRVSTRSPACQDCGLV